VSVSTKVAGEILEKQFFMDQLLSILKQSPTPALLKIYFFLLAVKEESEKGFLVTFESDTSHRSGKGMRYARQVRHFLHRNMIPVQSCEVLELGKEV